MYFLAAMLDPQFGLNWVDLDVTNNENAVLVKKFREDLKRSLIGNAFLCLNNITMICLHV